MEIKVLGACCAKCKNTYQVIEKVIKESGLDVELTQITDMEEIMEYNVMTIPAVVVDGEVKITLKHNNEELRNTNGCYLITQFSSNPTNRFILSELSFLAKVTKKFCNRKMKYFQKYSIE